MATLQRAHRLHTRTDSLYADWYIRAEETSVDTANNRSYVSVAISIFCSSGYSFSATNSGSGLTGTSDTSFGYRTYSAGETTLASGGFWVPHNDNGEASAHIFYWGSTTYGSGCSGDFWLGLTTIARSSQPSINTYPNNSPDITAGVACTIHMNKKSTFTHNVSYWFGNKKGTIATGVVDNCLWTPPTSLLDQIPNTTIGSGTILVDTYSGNTKIGETKSCGFNLHLPSNSEPTVGTITLTEQHAGVKAKNANVTVQQISKKLVSVPVSAKYSASIKTVTCDGVVLSNNDGTYTGYISNKSNGTYKVTVTDSRGLQSSNAVEQTFYEYAKPFITATLKRESETSAKGALSVSGSYSTILSNTLFMTIQRNDSSSPTTISPSLSNGKISYSKSYTDLNYAQSFIVKVKATDGFGESVETTAVLGIAQYAFAMIKHGVILGSDSYLFDKQNAMRSVLDFFYPVGTIYITEDKSFDPSKRWGGTWELIKDRMIIGAGNSYAVKSTGGEATHTLTGKEIPPHNHTSPIRIQWYNEVRNGVMFTGWGASNEQVDYQTQYTGYAGEGHAHNNLPPYYSAYIWRRTA